MVLILTGTLVFQLVATTGVVSQRLDRSEAQVRSAADAALDLPRLVHDVRPPFWAPAMTVDQGTNRLRVGYFRGVPSRTLELLVEDSRLVARFDTFEFRWGPFDDLSLKAWTEEGRTLGVEVRMRWKTEETTLRWAWGAHPL